MPWLTLSQQLFQQVISEKYLVEAHPNLTV